MSDRSPCEICGAPSETLPQLGDYVHRKCPRCGELKLSRTVGALVEMNGLDAPTRAKISGWIFDRNKDLTVPMITSDVLQKIKDRPLPTFAERADRLLLEALRGQRQLGDPFNIEEERFIAATYSQNKGEVRALLGMLSEHGWAKATQFGGICEVLPNGYVAADALTRRTKRSDKGFVAMAFCEELESVYEKGFQAGIMGAGYDPVRVDRVDHVNRIDDEIVAQIRNASFVVADFTGHRGGVYFEAGFALGLNMPVIWTCRKDHMKDLHFDIRQYNTIDWETPEDLAPRLRRRIEAVLGKGPNSVLDS